MKTSKHVYLIDDDEVTNLINSQVIHLSNFASRVSTFVDAAEALAKLTDIEISGMDTFPFIIFLDIAMPGMNGWGFLDALIKLPEPFQNKCNVIMLTSSIDLFDIRKAKRYNLVKDYILKPLDIKNLAILGSQKHGYFSISQSAVNAI